jgi:F0F1-type ATP synthase assembly protein I
MTARLQTARVRPGIRQATSDDGWAVLSYLITGVFLYGGLGWLGDVLLGTAFLLPVGLVFGAGLALYTIYLRYGQSPVPPAGTDNPPDGQEGRR